MWLCTCMPYSVQMCILKWDCVGAICELIPAFLHKYILGTYILSCKEKTHSLEHRSSHFCLLVIILNQKVLVFQAAMFLSENSKNGYLILVSSLFSWMLEMLWSHISCTPCLSLSLNTFFSCLILKFSLSLSFNSTSSRWAFHDAYSLGSPVVLIAPRTSLVITP